MRNFLKAGNNGNKNRVVGTEKSISIMILFPLSPLFPLCIPSRDSRKIVCAYAQNIFAKHTPICTKLGTLGTKGTEWLQITVFLFLLAQSSGNKLRTFVGTRRPTQ